MIFSFTARLHGLINLFIRSSIKIDQESNRAIKNP
jgi:hypothetical protein